MVFEQLIRKFAEISNETAGEHFTPRDAIRPPRPGTVRTINDPTAGTGGMLSVAGEPEVAHRHTGFLVGGTSPFGTKKAMPVYIETTILDLPLIYINGGRRGYLVGIDPQDLQRLLSPAVVVQVVLK